MNILADLASADSLTWATIVVKALTYAATLVAAGSVLVLLSLRSLDAGMRGALARLAAMSAIAAAALSVARLPLQASFLMGGGLQAAFDPIMLGMVVDGPLGASVMLRLAGLALVLAVLVPVRGGICIAGIGAVLAAASFAFRGHTLDEPRLLLAGLITLHMLALAYWLGVFVPLMRATRVLAPETVGALSREFGRTALLVVAALTAAGGLMLVLFGVATPRALDTSYGQAFAAKLALFCGVLSLAAVNKLRLTPALLASAPRAAARLRSSIRFEAVLIGAILLATAAATTVSAPPGTTQQAGPVLGLGSAPTMASLRVRPLMTVMQLDEELRALMYDDGHGAVLRHAATWKQAQGPGTAAAFVPLTFAPGEACQIDWSHEVVPIEASP